MLAQTTDQLADIFRTEVDDKLSAECTDGDCLWSDASVYRFMTEAADAVARAVRRTKKALYLNYTAVDGYARVPSSVQYLIDVRLADNGTQLTPLSAEEAFYSFNVSGVATGMPTNYFWEDDQRRLKLWPRPAEDGTLALFVDTRLGYLLVAGLPVPLTEVPEQRLMLTYMKARAYEQQDAETLDLNRAVAFQKQFDEASKNREVEVRKYTRPPGNVQMNW